MIVCHGSGHPSKVTLEVKALVEQQMIHNDKTTASQLHRTPSRHGGRAVRNSENTKCHVNTCS